MKKILSILAIAIVVSSCSNKAKDQAILEAAKQVALKEVRDSLRLDSFRTAEIAEKKEIERLAQVKEEREEKRMLLLSQQREASAPAATSGSRSNSSTTKTSAKKEGWSQAAKAGVIGGAAGAIGGAMIDKKKGRGAVIGGVVGAGTGYIIGRGQDRKSGRVQ